MLPVKHAPQDLCGHNDASCVWSNGDIAGHQAHVVIKLITQFPELLVAQSLQDGIALLCQLTNMLLNDMKQSTNSHGDATLVENPHKNYDATHKASLLGPQSAECFVCTFRGEV